MFNDYTHPVQLKKPMICLWTLQKKKNDCIFFAHTHIEKKQKHHILAKQKLIDISH